MKHGHRIQVFDESIPQDVDDHLRAASGWEINCVQLSKGRQPARTIYLKSDHYELFDKTTHGALLKSGCSPRGMLTIGLPNALSGPALHNGQRLGEDDFVVLTPSTEFELRTPEYLNFLVIAVSLEHLAPYLDAHGEAQTRGGQAGRSFVIRSPHKTALIERVRHLLSPTGNANDNLWADEHALFSTLAACLNAAGPYQSALSVAENRRRVVLRATSYIHSMLDTRITIPDLCGSIGAERRTLQNSFNDLLGISPLAYIKAVRLGAARRAIKQGQPSAGDIGDIAFRLGFGHLSQFAKDYRAIFWELPSETKTREMRT